MKDFKIPKPTEQEIHQSGNLFKSIFLLSLLIGSFYITQLGVTAIDTYFDYNLEPAHLIVKWTFVIVLALLNCFVLTGLAVIAHEGIHGVLFKNWFLNDMWGGILSFLAWMLPFYANRQFHLTHHRYTHQPGLDPEEPLHNHSFLYAFFMGAPIAIYQHYKIVATNLLSLVSGNWNKGYRGLKDVGFVIVGVVFYAYLIPLLGISPWYTVVPTFLVLPVMYSFRSLCDHYAFEPALSPVARKNFNAIATLEDDQQNVQTEQLQIDSWVILTNPVLNWLWSNIAYQQVHHRYSYLSYRYLPEVFEATKHEQPYAVAKGYLQCLMALKNRPYYGKQEDLKQFLIT